MTCRLDTNFYSAARKSCAHLCRQPTLAGARMRFVVPNMDVIFLRNRHKLLRRRHFLPLRGQELQARLERRVEELHDVSLAPTPPRSGTALRCPSSVASLSARYRAKDRPERFESGIAPETSASCSSNGTARLPRPVVPALSTTASASRAREETPIPRAPSEQRLSATSISMPEIVLAFRDRR